MNDSVDGIDYRFREPRLLEEALTHRSAGSSNNERLEFLGDEDGWLVAANEFQATTPAGEWPLTSMRVETGKNEDGEISMVDVQASYLNFADAAVAMPLKCPMDTARSA